jgi:hypothetical protein
MPGIYLVLPQVPYQIGTGIRMVLPWVIPNWYQYQYSYHYYMLVLCGYLTCKQTPHQFFDRIYPDISSGDLLVTPFYPQLWLQQVLKISYLPLALTQHSKIWKIRTCLLHPDTKNSQGSLNETRLARHWKSIHFLRRFWVFQGSQFWVWWKKWECSRQLQFCTWICSWMWPWNKTIECHLCQDFLFMLLLKYGECILDEGEKISKCVVCFCYLLSLISHASCVLCLVDWSFFFLSTSSSCDMQLQVFLHFTTIAITLHVCTILDHHSLKLLLMILYSLTLLLATHNSLVSPYDLNSLLLVTCNSLLFLFDSLLPLCHGIFNSKC